MNRLQLGADGFTGIVEEELYHGESGEPILLRCNQYDAVTDCEITIVGSDGSFSKWYPCTNPNNGLVSADTIGSTCIDITDYELGYRSDLNENLNELISVSLTEFNSITVKVIEGDTEDYANTVLEYFNEACKDWGIEGKSLVVKSITPTDDNREFYEAYKAVWG